MSIPLLESREPQLLVPEARVVSSAAPHSGAAVLQGRVGALEPLLPRRRGLASSTGLPPPCSPPGLRLFAAGTISFLLEFEGSQTPSLAPRSEERRVGKGGRSRWSPYH